MAVAAMVAVVPTSRSSVYKFTIVMLAYLRNKIHVIGY